MSNFTGKVPASKAFQSLQLIIQRSTSKKTNNVSFERTDIILRSFLYEQYIYGVIEETKSCSSRSLWIFTVRSVITMCSHNGMVSWKSVWWMCNWHTFIAMSNGFTPTLYMKPVSATYVYYISVFLYQYMKKIQHNLRVDFSVCIHY